MDKKRWKIQNKLYRMKARKLELERFIIKTTKDYLLLKVFNPFRKLPKESYTDYFLSILHIIIFGLDIILGFYYNKFKAFRILKAAKKEILTLTKEIKYYEQY